MYRKTYVEINLDNIENNVKNILNSYSGYNYYFGVVKGSAYGHGPYIVNTLIDSGINYLAVADLDEALEIRKYNKKIPILCLEPIDVDFLDVCSKNNVTITVSNEEYVNKIKDTNLALKVHFKINSGMNRLGFSDAKTLKKSYDILKLNKNIFIEGIFTHMGTLGISDPYWDKQLNNFVEITNEIDLKQIPIIHIERSATMMCHEKIDFCNGVRIGISLYGYNQLPLPSNTFKGKLKNLKSEIKKCIYNVSKTNPNLNIDLKPALSLYSEVIDIQKVKKGDFVGYFGYLNNESEFLAATVSIGYADGLDLRLKNGNVFINGKKYQIVGTINMGMISVKIDDDVKIGDIVEIIGAHINIRNVSRHVGTTIYETMTSLSPLLPRVYIKNGKIEKIIERMK